MPRAYVVAASGSEACFMLGGGGRVPGAAPPCSDAIMGGQGEDL